MDTLSLSPFATARSGRPSPLKSSMPPTLAIAGEERPARKKAPNRRRKHADVVAAQIRDEQIGVAIAVDVGNGGRRG